MIVITVNLKEKEELKLEDKRGIDGKENKSYRWQGKFRNELEK